MKIKSAIQNRSVRFGRPSITQALEQRTLLAATPITSGQYVTGSIVAGGTASYTFSANSGDSFFVSFADTGNTSFIPKVTVLKPDNTQLDVNFSNTGATLEELSVANSGTYTLNVTDYNGNVGGAFALTMLKAPAAQPTDADSGPLTSGVQVNGTIDLGDADVYTFTANTGDAVLLTLADTTGNAFLPEMELFTPGGSRLDYNFNNTGSNIEQLNLSTSGTYTVFVHDYNGNAAGNYAMTMVRTPAVQPTDLDSGPITSGTRNFGTIGLGDIDVYTFTANVGNTLAVSFGELGNTSFLPEAELFSPTGARVGYNFSNVGANVTSLQVSVAGTYTLVLHDYNGSAGGQYAFTMAKSGVAQTNELGSGGDSGPISGGLQLIGNIDTGDIDIYTINATAGQSLELSVGDATTTSFLPQIVLYKPDGTFLDATNGNNGSGMIDTALPTTGTYNVFVYDYNGNATGSYHIALSQAGAGATPAADLLDNDGGALNFSSSRSGSVTAGDQDDYTFNFTTGSAASINVRDLLSNSFQPYVEIFGPGGTEIDADAESTNASAVIPAAAASGTYLVVVSDFGYSNPGNYSITVNNTPAADTRAPNVTTARFDYAAPQQQVVLTMNENIGTSLGVGDLTLYKDGVAVDSSNLSASFNAAENEIIVQFPLYTYRALPDGNYSLVLGAGTVTDTAGLANASAYTYNFFSLAGDANHDRTVNIADLGALATNYGGLGRNFAQGDFNYDGVVNIADLGYLATQYGKTVAAPPSLLPSSYSGPAAAAYKSTFSDSRIASDVLQTI